MESKSSIPLESESVALHEKSTVIHVIAKLAAAIKAVRLSLQIGDQMEFRVLQHACSWFLQPHGARRRLPLDYMSLLEGETGSMVDLCNQLPTMWNHKPRPEVFRIAFECVVPAMYAGRLLQVVSRCSSGKSKWIDCTRDIEPRMGNEARAFWLEHGFAETVALSTLVQAIGDRLLAWYGVETKKEQLTAIWTYSNYPRFREVSFAQFHRWLALFGPLPYVYHRASAVMEPENDNNSVAWFRPDLFQFASASACGDGKSASPLSSSAITHLHVVPEQGQQSLRPPTFQFRVQEQPTVSFHVTCHGQGYRVQGVGPAPDHYGTIAHCIYKHSGMTMKDKQPIWQVLYQRDNEWGNRKDYHRDQDKFKRVIQRYPWAVGDSDGCPMLFCVTAPAWATRYVHDEQQYRTLLDDGQDSEVVNLQSHFHLQEQQKQKTVESTLAETREELKNVETLRKDDHAKLQQLGAQLAASQAEVEALRTQLGGGGAAARDAKSGTPGAPGPTDSVVALDDLEAFLASHQLSALYAKFREQDVTLDILLNLRDPETQLKDLGTCLSFGHRMTLTAAILKRRTAKTV